MLKNDRNATKFMNILFGNPNFEGKILKCVNLVLKMKFTCTIKKNGKMKEKQRICFVFFPKIFSLIFEFFFFLFVGFTLNYLQNDTF